MLNVYSIHDVKGVYTSPFTDLSDASACRGFSYSVLNQGDIVGFAPADFSLYRIGTFDERKCIFVPEAAPVFLMSGADALTGGVDNATES